MRLKLLICALFLLLPPLAWSADYVIGEGDGLDISVWGVKELNVGVKVRPDGKITIPGLGDVVASGFTPAQLQADLARRLKELVKNPIVTVTVREITNSKVYIFGGGVQSGVVDLNRRTTLLQLLCSIGNVGAGDGKGGGSAAGPSTKVADYRKAYVLRNGKKVKEDFYRLFITGDTSEDIVIESGDAIFIPQALEKNVYVLGAVTNPRFIEYREGMTVMEAILESGGFTKFARQNDTVIRRRDGDKEALIEVKAKDLVKDGDLSQNVKLSPGDYIIVKEGMF
ncbi:MULTISPECIES: polysaccharide biosynthesis/export family protein [Geobacter]|uniref:polysaccharide biosynthesis/export family protein n=1 Tax=Geobacter TaxID=28231 RepID=UPI002B316482|nr:polysaccharide biosynthesis/export family protein [Geobacter sulfurreducens]BET58392.1 polysaccharide biosynthesis/export family protein [Geobacter sp. 60473]HML77992.1 polysaccharide biosynthesis/export family protein [Geobacter sulfurreducens]